MIMIIGMKNNEGMTKAEFLDAVAEAVVMEEIPAELVLNCDKTCIKLVPSSVWMIERQAGRNGGCQ